MTESDASRIRHAVEEHARRGEADRWIDVIAAIARLRN
jgi:hypothetical protein